MHYKIYVVALIWFVKPMELL